MNEKIKRNWLQKIQFFFKRDIGRQATWLCFLKETQKKKSQDIVLTFVLGFLITIGCIKSITNTFFGCKLDNWSRRYKKVSINFNLNWFWNLRKKQHCFLKQCFCNLCCLLFLVSKHDGSPTQITLLHTIFCIFLHYLII